jgi:hypothetical protein
LVDVDDTIERTIQLLQFDTICTYRNLSTTEYIIWFII